MNKSHLRENWRTIQRWEGMVCGLLNPVGPAGMLEWAPHNHIQPHCSNAEFTNQCFCPISLSLSSASKMWLGCQSTNCWWIVMRRQKSIMFNILITICIAVIFKQMLSGLVSLNRILTKMICMLLSWVALCSHPPHIPKNMSGPYLSICTYIFADVIKLRWSY